MIVTTPKDEFVQFPGGGDTERVFKTGVISNAGYGWVLIRILGDGKSVVEINPEIACVEIKRQFGAGREVNPVQFRMQHIGRIARAQGQVDRVLVRDRPEHLSV